MPEAYPGGAFMHRKILTSLATLVMVLVPATTRSQTVPMQSRGSPVVGGSVLDTRIPYARQIDRRTRASIEKILGVTRSVPERIRHSSSEVTAAGIITGLVRDRRSQQPLNGAQVYIQGTGLGGLSNAAGRYRITGVPAGTVTLRVALIGFAAAQKPVVVRDGLTVTADFELAETALALDEIVVTGTPGGAQKRAIGNSITSMQAVKLVEAAPTISFQQLLGQKMAGVMVVPGAGMVGGSGSIRIRGVSSPALTNEPIIYVDGVRIDNTPGGPNGRMGPQLKRMDDLNLSDIESIEVIKGPAAATLYGTEASNGVLQIITKRGVQGQPIWDFTFRQGANYFRDPDSRFPDIWGKDPTTGQIISVNLWKQERDAGRNFIRTGQLQTFGGSVKGGTKDVRYFLSADMDNNNGIFAWNNQKRVNTRANLSITPSERFTIDTNVALTFTNSRLAMTDASFPEWDLIVWGQVPALLTPTRGFRVLPPEALAKIESRSDVNRVTGSLRLNYNPWKWLSNRLTLGIDANQEVNSIFWPREPDGQPHFYGAQTLGEKRLQNRSPRNISVDYVSTGSLMLTPDIHGATSVGVQFFDKRILTSTALGKTFPISTVEFVTGAAVTQGGEDFLENKTIGTFVQQQVDWKNRLFLTGALRGDDNSAFGANFKAIIYPKVSVAWVINEEPFFKKVAFVNALKLRGAWGQSGQQPDVFAAQAFYAPTTGPGDGSVVTPQTIGNPDLQPELGSEVEFGFDASMLGQRINVEFTHFNRSVSKAILAKPVPPSSGIPGQQFVNLGLVKSWGNELGINGRLAQRKSFAWDVGVNITTQDNRVEDLGGVISAQHFKGYPLASIFNQKVVSAEFVPGTLNLRNVLCDGGTGADGLRQGGAPTSCDVAPRVYWGKSQPTWLGNVSTSLTFFRNLQLSALVEYRGGNLGVDSDLLARQTTYANTAEVNPVTDPILQAYRLVVNRTPIGLFNAGYATLRDVSATYTMPEHFTRRFGFSRTQISVAARNAFPHLWEAQDFVWGHKMIDVESVQSVGGEFATGAQMIIPQTAQIITTIRVTL
jgi:TonB-linked SusC/RagA family outer membrane protein